MAAFGNTPFYLKHLVSNGIVEESYVGFIVTSTMAQANSGMTAGTYYIKGGTTSSNSANEAVLQSAFGENGGYCIKYSSSFECSVSGLVANVDQDGYVSAKKGARICLVDNIDGVSYCA